MTSRFLKLADPLIVPGIALGLAVLLVRPLAAAPPSQIATIALLPYIVLGMGLALSWRFNQNRVFFVLTMLVLIYWCVREGWLEWTGQERRVLLHFIGLLLPASIALIAVLKDRGVFTVHGLICLVTIFVPVSATVALVIWPDVVVLLPGGFARLSSSRWTAMTPAVLGAFTLSAGILLIQLTCYRRSVDSALFGTVLALAVVFHMGARPTSTMVLLTAAGAMLLFGVIQDGYRKAYVDELTGLPGRRALEEELLKLGGSYAVAMVDVDRFKKFNDTHGHDAGDQVLRMVAAQLRRVTGGGRPFRYGGEEFTILFPGKTVKEALEHLERVRKDIANSPFGLRRGHRGKARKPSLSSRGRKRITVSMGIAQRNARRATPHKVIKAADRALYRAKQTGRNRVCH
ncbi:MAG: diguanylate cyclase [Acidiferrobacterales bacterium]